MQVYKKKLPYNILNLAKAKLLLFILLTSGTNLYSQDQTLTITESSLTVLELFKRIESQTTYNVAYPSINFDINREIKVEAPKQTVKQMLVQALKGSDYSYRILLDYILIEPTSESGIEEPIITKAVKGKILNYSTNDAIANASVRLIGNERIKTTTDTKGNFALKNVPVGDQTIRIVAKDYTSSDFGISVSMQIESDVIVLLKRAGNEASTTSETKESETGLVPIAPRIFSKLDTTYVYPSVKDSLIELNTRIEALKNNDSKAFKPVFAEKINLLYLATTTLNVGVEVSVANKWTVESTFGYNPWKFGEGKIKHWLIMPEIRYWPCQSFEGHFFGIHGIYSQFNIGELSLFSSLKDRSYKGDLYGGGLSYGYHFPLKGKWSMELTAGVGFVRLNYDKYQCDGCKELLGSYKRDYWGPTKAGVSLIYMID